MSNAELHRDQLSAVSLTYKDHLHRVAEILRIQGVKDSSEIVLNEILENLQYT